MLQSIVFWIAVFGLAAFLSKKVMDKIDCKHPDPFGIWAMPISGTFIGVIAIGLGILHITGLGEVLGIYPWI